MLVHLKVAAELPVDVFAVTLSVIYSIYNIYNPGWFWASYLRIFNESEACPFLFFLCLVLVCCLRLCF